MFASHLNEIMYRLLPARPEQLINLGAWRDIDTSTRTEIQKSAEKALSAPIPPMRATDWIHSHEAFSAAKRERRDQLSSLLLGSVCAGSERYIEKIIDLAWAVCEETAWRDAFTADALRAGENDLMAFETASLLSWMLQLVGNSIRKLSAEIYQLIADELEKRIFLPFIAREVPEWTMIKDEYRLSRLCALLSALLLGCEDDRRRWLGIRRCLVLIDNAVEDLPRDGVHPRGLEAWAIDAEAISNAATLLLMATGGDVDVRSEKKFLRIADYPVNAHMANGRFVNPDGDTTPPLSGEALFRIGECADNAALKRLGASIGEREIEAKCPNATSRVFASLMRRAFLAEAAVYPIRRQVLLPSGMLAAADASLFRACLTGGSFTAGHADAGNMHVYFDGKPVICDVDPASSAASLHSLPNVNGFEVMKGFGGAKDLEARFEDAFICLSINLAPGFDELAGVTSWQRTLMMSRVERRIRIIEAFDLTQPAEKVLFRFTTPLRPEADGEGAYILGIVRLAWEGNLRSSVDKIRGGYRITVEAPPGGLRGNYAFILSQA